MSAGTQNDDAPLDDFQTSDVTLLQAARFRVDRVTQTFSDGRQFSREVIRHPGAVVILPILPDGCICLIRNYRVAVGSWLLELPAGTLEPGEPPIETARRELIEETGYRAEELRPLCQLLMSPGILHERMHVFVAEALTPGRQATEPGEQIVTHLVTADELDGLVRDGRIEDAKTVAAWLYYRTFM